MITNNGEGKFLQYPHSTGKFVFMMTTAINPGGLTDVPEEAIEGSKGFTVHPFGASSSFVSDGEHWVLDNSVIDQEVPAVSRVVRGTLDGDFTDSPGDQIILGNLTLVKGTDFFFDDPQPELLVDFLTTHLEDIPALSVVDNEDGTFDITFIAGSVANDIICTSDDPALTFQDINSDPQATMVVTGIGAGIYTWRGLDGSGLSYYNLEGQASIYGGGYALYTDDGGLTWYITDADGVATNSSTLAGVAFPSQASWTGSTVAVVPAGADLTYGQSSAQSGSGITNTALANTVMKSDGTNAVPSRITDDGTDIAINSGAGVTTIGDVNGNGNSTFAVVDDSAQTFDITAPNGMTLNGSSIGGASITNDAPEHKLTKSDADGNLVASRIDDDGSTVSMDAPTVTIGDLTGSGWGIYMFGAAESLSINFPVVLIHPLPTSDPHNEGQLYTAAGVLMVSAG